MTIIHQTPGIIVSGRHPEDFNDPLNWTLIENWDTNNGVGMNEMASIDAAFNNSPRGNGACWNLTGTILTLGSTTDDTIRTFLLSTPWDPDTASLIATRSVTNPTHLYMNAAGTQLWTLVIVGDLIRNYPCNGFVISALDVSSDVSKGEFGWTGSGDGSFYPTRDFNSMIWDGSIPGGRSRRGVFTPNGNLDSFSLSPIVVPPYNVNASIGGSKISNDGLSFYRGVGAPGVEWITMTTPYDVDQSNGCTFVTRDIDVSEIGFRPNYIVVNPDDMREVWIVGDNSGGLQLARMATGL